MARPLEVVLTSDGSGQFWNVCAWNHENGAVLRTFKGSTSAPHTLSLVSHDFLISGQPDKPLLNLWRLEKTDQAQTKLVCPGRPSSVAVSPDGVYCVVGIQEKLYFWELCSGNLLSVISKHYLPVTCLKFTDDGSHVISGGEDTVVNAWSLHNVLDKSEEFEDSEVSAVVPYQTWTHHSLPVTDIHVGHGGISCRVFTVSADRTCRIYDLLSGQLLLNFIFDIGLSAVVTDPVETRLFVGGGDGKIFQINLFDPPRTIESHVKEEEDGARIVFVGHSKKILCLSVSCDGNFLISGCADHKAMIWHVDSGHCLNTLDHKGPVTNVAFVPCFEGFFSTPSSKKLAPPVHPLKRTLISWSEEQNVIPLKIPNDLAPQKCSHHQLRQVVTTVK